MPGQIQRIYLGNGKYAYVPSRKKLEFTRAITLRFGIAGLIPAKKNNQLITINTAWAQAYFKRLHLKNPADPIGNSWKVLSKLKPQITMSDEAHNFNTRVGPLLQEQAAIWAAAYEKENLIYPITRCSIKIYHYWRDNRKRDNPGRTETIHDLLKDLKIISDDAWQNIPLNASEAAIYPKEVADNLTVIYLTAYDW